MSQIKTLKILKSKNSIDFFSFIEGYAPLLKKREVVLFMRLFAQSKINVLTKCDEYDYSKFLSNYRLDYQEVERDISGLSKLNLVTVKDDLDCRTIKIEKVKSLSDLMKDSNFNLNLKNHLTEDKYSELVYITGEEMETIESKHELNKQTYASFYSGVLGLLGSEFTLSSEAIKIIKNHEDNITMETLHQCAYLSAIKTNGKYHISSDHLDFLIKQKLFEEPKQFNIDDHQDFWRSLYSSEMEETSKNFEQLFGKNDPFNLYKLLTSRDKAPDALHKWIRSVVQDDHFQFPIINALLSFVMCLLGKVPINYLIKVSHTLKNDYSANKIGLIKLAKNVIENDIKNGKNRLNVKIKEREKTIPREERIQHSKSGDKSREVEDSHFYLYSG